MYDTLAGQIGVGGITISWTSDSETTDVDYYKVLRYDCGTPGTCSVDVETIDAIGSCGTGEFYSIEDDPPAPYSSWTYSVEVWRTDETRACAIDVVPES